MSGPSFFLRFWRALAPQPLPPYALPDRLDALPLLIRVAEVFCWAFNWLERTLSPSGRLRSWILLNLLVALGIAIPALTVVPAVTLVFEGVAQWAELLTRIAFNLLLTAMALLGLLVVLRVIEAVAKRRR
jgi:hypothetical protein